MTKIEWSDETVNLITGCTPISAGCQNCYARAMTKRLQGMERKRALEHKEDEVQKYAAGFDEVNIWPSAWDKVKKWKKPRRVFLNSMSDTFHDEVPEWFIFWMFRKMNEYSQHTFQILTKRPERVVELQNRMALRLRFTPNIWMGVTVENVQALDRIEHLRKLDAHVRFVSFEPLLGPLPFLALHGIDWAIIGCETGPGHRPMEDKWVRAIIREAKRKHVDTRIFYKQKMVDGKKIRLPELDGKRWMEFPEGGKL